MHFFQERSDEMQSYAINQVQVLVTFVPARLFVFLPLPILAVLMRKKINSQIFALPRPTFQAKSTIPWVL